MKSFYESFLNPNFFFVSFDQVSPVWPVFPGKFEPMIVFLHFPRHMNILVFSLLEFQQVFEIAYFLALELLAACSCI